MVCGPLYSELWCHTGHVMSQLKWDINRERESPFAKPSHNDNFIGSTVGQSTYLLFVCRALKANKFKICKHSISGNISSASSNIYPLSFEMLPERVLPFIYLYIGIHTVEGKISQHAFSWGLQGLKDNFSIILTICRFFQLCSRVCIESLWIHWYTFKLTFSGCEYSTCEYK